MRQLRRLSLSPVAANTLARLQRKVNRASDSSAEAKVMWPRRRNSTPKREAFEEVKRKLRRMAPGRERCMYCEDSEGTDIDHFRPKSQYPSCAFKWPNYLYACSRCNSNEKRDDFPLDAAGNPLLIDPTAEDPTPHFAMSRQAKSQKATTSTGKRRPSRSETSPRPAWARFRGGLSWHGSFQLVPETGQLVPLSPKGDSTAQVFGLNRREVLTEGRRYAWTTLLELLRAYDDAASKGQARRVKALRKAIRETPFSCVLSCLVQMAAAPAEPGSLPAVPVDVRKILQCRTEIRRWL